MDLLKSFIAWAVLIVVLYATGKVIAADGWLAGGVFLLAVALFFGIIEGIRGFLSAPFSCRRNRQTD